MQHHISHAQAACARAAKLFCSSELFVLSRGRCLIVLIALVFLPFFFLLLNLQTFSTASHVFVLIKQKIGYNETLERYQGPSSKLVFSDNCVFCLTAQSLERVNEYSSVCAGCPGWCPGSIKSLVPTLSQREWTVVRRLERSHIPDVTIEKFGVMKS